MEMYFYIIFQTDMLINIFIPLRRDEAIIWENFVPAKRDPGSTKEGSRLVEIKLFDLQSQDIIYKEFITMLESRQNRAEFHPSQPGSCNHHFNRKKLLPHGQTVIAQFHRVQIMATSTDSNLIFWTFVFRDSQS